MPKDQAESAAYIARRLREEFLDQLVDAIKYHAVKGSAPYMVEALNRVAGKVTDKTELNIPLGSAADDAIRFARELLTNDAVREHLEAAGRLLFAAPAESGDVRDGAEPGALED
jgi:hypothetical protein